MKKAGRPKGARNSGRQALTGIARRALKDVKEAVVAEIAARGPGKPPIAINWERVEQLLSLGCTNEEVAAGLGVDCETLTSKRNREQYLGVKNRVGARTALSCRQTLLGFMQGFRQPMVDDKGQPVLDAAGNQRTVTVMPSERVRFEATKFISKQKCYLGFSERTDVTSDGEKLPSTPTGIVSILIDDSRSKEE